MSCSIVELIIHKSHQNSAFNGLVKTSHASITTNSQSKQHYTLSPQGYDHILPTATFLGTNIHVTCVHKCTVGTYSSVYLYMHQYTEKLLLSHTLCEFCLLVEGTLCITSWLDYNLLHKHLPDISHLHSCVAGTSKGNNSSLIPTLQDY